MKKTALAFCLFIVLLALLLSLLQSGLMLASAESSIPKPSVPEFTVKLVDHSHVVPPTATIDPYTGQQTTNLGYTVENKTIDITIKNQPFSPPDNLTNIYYGVRVKGHFEEGWRELYYITNSTNGNHLLMQSTSENTVIAIPQDYPQDGKVDFQIEAVVATAHPLFSYKSNFGYWTWETSGWSSTQTVTIGTDSGFNWTEISLFAAFSVIIALLIAVPFMRRRQTKK